MSRLKKGVSIGLVLTLIGAGFVAYWSSKANRQIAEQEIYPAEQDAPGQIIQVNGRNMHVVVKGDVKADPTGVPLVLLHGFSIGAYETWFPWADSLTTARTIIVPDMLGFGHSERVTEPHHDLTHEGQAALLNGLLDALGVTQVDLVGRSFGGAVGSQLILDYPDRVRRVAYIGAHVYWDEPNRASFLGQKLGALPWGVGRAFVWNSMGGGAGGFAGRACLTTGENCDRHRITLITGTVDGLRAMNANRQMSRLPRDIGQVAIPVMVMWGEEDPIVPLDHGRRLAKATGARIFEIVPGGGHWPYEKDPEGAAAKLLAFFDQPL